MAFTIVQSATAHTASNGTRLVATFGSNITAGNLVVCGYALGPGIERETSVQDGPGDTFTDTIQNVQWDATASFGFAWAANSLGGSKTVTLNIGSFTGKACAMVVAEISGVATSSPLDGSTSNTGNSTVPTTGSGITTTNANDILIAFLSATGTPSSIGSFTSIASDNTEGTPDVEMMYVIETSTGTYTWSGGFNTSKQYGACILGFKAGAAATIYPSQYKLNFVQPPNNSKPIITDY